MRRLVFLLLLVSPLLGDEPSSPLAPFVLPWNDPPTGAADLSSWNTAPAGARGFVTVDRDGHFSAGGERVRFIGVDITSQSCFPIAEYADAAAARLARFGVNNVRFHHMDADWNKTPLINYAAGNSLNLNPEAFARLHRFVSALDARGIYSDINLLVSHHYSSADGFPKEIEKLGWKDQHILGFFDAHALSLQRDYAKQLLTTPGPHGEKPFAQNPAVAFVEILNENGLIQKWYEGVLDTLPAPFLAELTERWNQWLRSRYTTTGSLRKAWGGATEPAGQVVQGSSLSVGDDRGWKPFLNAKALISVTSRQDAKLGDVIKFAVTRTDPSEWSQARLRSSELHLTPGRLYTLSFSVRADTPTNLTGLLVGSSPSTAHQVIGASATREWTSRSVSFVAPNGPDPVRLELGGMDHVNTIELANLTLREGGELVGLSAEGNLEKGTVAPVRHQSSNTPGLAAAVQLDWMRFMVDLESSYWKGMSDYIKTTLGFRGVVFGTIISTSPVGVQSQLASVDGHSYWQHPRFPNSEWDETNWSVAPKSMVTDLQGSTICDLAVQRVKGRPFTVTEYQHPAPNPYSGESPIFAAAYGALQDWDGFWFFEYAVPQSKAALSGYEGRISGFFDDSQHPTRFVNYLIAAALFRRGDVAPATEEVVVPLSHEREIELLRTRGRAWRMPDAGIAGLPSPVALQHRVAIQPNASTDELPQTGTETKGRIQKSDTGELVWDSSKPESAELRIVTNKTLAVVGFVGGREIQLGNVSAKFGAVSDNWATLGMTYLDGDSSHGGRGLIVATAKVENTRQRWKDAGRTTLGKSWGQAPTRIETVHVELILPFTSSRVAVYSLDSHGKRNGSVPVQDREGKTVVLLGEKNPATLWYEFVIN